MKPKLIVIAGRAASGKTTIAKVLAQEIGAVYEDSTIQNR